MSENYSEQSKSYNYGKEQNRSADKNQNKSENKTENKKQNKSENKSQNRRRLLRIASSGLGTGVRHPVPIFVCTYSNRKAAPDNIARNIRLYIVKTRIYFPLRAFGAVQ